MGYAWEGGVGGGRSGRRKDGRKGGREGECALCVCGSGGDGEGELNLFFEGWGGEERAEGMCMLTRTAVDDAGPEERGGARRGGWFGAACGRGEV